MKFSAIVDYKIGKFLIISVLIIHSCHNEEPDSYRVKNRSKLTAEEMKVPLMNANIIRVKAEDDAINAYIKRHNLKMEQSGTGLRYVIDQEGNGEKANKGKVAVIDYQLCLLDGTPCYSSKETGLKEFIIGAGSVENGLDEGILLLKVGSKAKFILPSHLAFGLLGDGNKIPHYAILMYDLELKGIK